MIVRKDIDITKNPTKEQIEMLKALKDRPIVFDEDCPELTEEELQQFKPALPKRQIEQKEETVTLRLSPQALKKAKSFGNEYTAVLSKMLEKALMDNENIKL